MKHASKELSLTSYSISYDTTLTVSYGFRLHRFDGTVDELTEVVDFGIGVVSGTLTASAISLIEALHVALAINYYKPLLPEVVTAEYESKSFNGWFWEQVYRNGLGEFAYLNNIQPEYIGTFGKGFTRDVQFDPRDGMRIDPKLPIMVGIGGGKDSLVGWEVVRSAGADAVAFICESPSNNNSLRRDVMDSIQSPQTIIAVRTPDEKLRSLRKEAGAYRGHTPMSVIIALMALTTCEIAGYSAFAVSNESSSDEPNLIWNGFPVNHQWTKTTEFENLLRGYIDTLHVTTDYFSVLRPLTELGISSIFARLEKYHSVFFSCNKSILGKDGEPVKWCGVCAKCVSSALLLSPFLSRTSLSEIIGHDVFLDMSLLPLFEGLLGLGDFRPFDCILGKEEACTVINRLSTLEDYRGTPVVESMAKRIEQEDVVNFDQLTLPHYSKTFPEIYMRAIEDMRTK